MYQRDHHQFIWHIAFRDWLRSHPEDRDAYEALKRRLAIEHSESIEAYADAKSDFVRSILRKAGVTAGLT